jgi:glycosyltransferase involved in cell wall biosynthesis
MSFTSKKILFLIPHLSSGGAERATCDLVNALAQTGETPSLFLLSRSMDLAKNLDPKIRVESFSPPGKFPFFLHPKLVFRLIRLIRKVDFVVGSYDFETTFYASIFSRFLGKKGICWLHIDFAEHYKSSFLKRLLFRGVYFFGSAFVAASSGVAESHRRLFGIKDVFHIPNPIDLFEIKKAASENINHTFLKSLPLPFIAGSGRLVEQKDFETLILAFAEIVSSGFPQSLIILGEGPLREKLENFASQRGLKEKIYFPGFTPNPFPIIRRADCFVLSSKFEGFSLVVAEALCLGVPVVATDCRSGPAEILENGNYGILIPVGEPKKLADGIIRIFTDIELKNKFKSLGPVRAEFFNSRKVAHLWQVLLQKL